MYKKSQSGQALITLIVFMLIATTITSAAVAVLITNSAGANKLQQSDIDYQIAESGMENAVLRLLRDPGYHGETMRVGNDNATITVSGSGPYTITSTNDGQNTRKIQVTADFTGNILTILSWKEIY